jgi:hypothetical protein
MGKNWSHLAEIKYKTYFMMWMETYFCSLTDWISYHTKRSLLQQTHVINYHISYSMHVSLCRFCPLFMSEAALVGAEGLIRRGHRLAMGEKSTAD